MIVYPVLNALIAISSVFRLEIDLADIMQEFCCALLIEAVVPALANVSSAQEMHDFLFAGYHRRVVVAGRSKPVKQWRRRQGNVERF
jgi:hypothetical protein